MNRQPLSLAFVLLATCFGGAQSSAAIASRALPHSLVYAIGKAAPQSQASAENASVISIVLAKSLDAKKLKTGDPVEAKTTAELSANGITIPKGSLVKGHITQATARSKGGEQSSLGIAFDTIQLKNGQPIPLKAGIQAVGAPPALAPGMLQGEPSAPIGSAPGSPGAPSVTSPPMVGGGNAPMGGVQQPGSNLPQEPSSQQNSSGSATLNEKSTGVIGLRGVQLESGSILTSSGKDLKLDSGTEMILRVQNQ